MAKDPSKLRLVRRPALEPTFTFSPAQNEVITHRGSALVVYGGPGTGKTTTLIESVISRVREGSDPNSILILTYGRERASELRDAIALRAGSTSFEPLARTFHSLCFSILNEKLAHDNARYVLVSGGEQDSAIGQMLGNPLVTIPWHQDLNQAITTRGFVREVRDLILRATELGLSAKDLQERGLLLNEKYWDGAAHFWASYRGANELQSASVGEQIVRIDPSAIITETLNLLEQDENRLSYFRNRFKTIVVDEFQESDASQRKLLQLLAPPDLLIFADPDSAIGRFRGADPDSLVSYLATLQMQQLLLSQDVRSTPAISSLISEVATRFHTRSAGRPRVMSKTELAPEPIELAKLSSQSESANFIAHQLRSAHLRDATPWSQMAVIVRSPGAEVAALQRAFANNAIPVSIDSAALALAENPAIKPLLLLAGVVLKSAPLDASDWPILEEILFSEFGGTDALQLRQIRLAFAAVRSDSRSTTEMMIDALTDSSASLPWNEITPLKRINDLLKAGHKALRSSRDISELLWALWGSALNYEGSQIAYIWRQRALAGGARGAQADRDLDAVIQLFEAARRFSERNVGASPILFISQLTNERILSDSITTSAQRDEVVTITTVHSAKGLEWDFVVVTGLQEGVWPNLKERGSLLGSERLVEAERSGLTIRAEIAAAAATGLLEDERRLLYVAISRAKSRLLIAAFTEEDSEPSRYFEELFEAVYHTSSDGFSTQLPRQISTPALVATLRRSAMTGSDFAAALLKSLSQGGIQSADPSSWLGVRELSSTDPIATAEDDVYVSPSSLESFGDCGLKWFLERSGARDGDSTAQLLGVAIHFIASELLENPDLTFEQGLAQLNEAWPVVDQNVGWYKEQQLKEATRMLKRFFEWHQANPRELVLAEADMESRFGRAILKGSVDRLERDRISGHYFVVDIKTGSPVSTEEAREHKQLAAYQLGVVSGGFPEIEVGAISDGAGLLYLSKTTNKITTIDQNSLNQEEVIAELMSAATGMSAATFDAIINKRCRTCQVRSLCPLQSEGRSVME
jgi:superfamily I DNA/RNA helicase/CRISPR/Cas system-associated exonuclease Cas4 (RecB family)